MQQSFELIAKTFQGLEEVLAQELIELGANDVQIGRRMVSFSGDQEMMYRANFCLRTAVRVLKPISHFRARNADDVYKAVKEIEWNDFLDLDTSFVVDTTVYSTEFRNSKFVAYKVKDAIVDYFMEREGKRPNISVSNPDLRLNIHIAEESCTLSLDSSGESLHLRGYRTATVDAPINEVLAAALIKMSGWQFDCDLIDPFCGSGTILVEAALMARNIYPGVFRRKFGFENWKDFNPELLSSIFDDDSNERTFEHRIMASTSISALSKPHRPMPKPPVWPISSPSNNARFATSPNPNRPRSSSPTRLTVSVFVPKISPTSTARWAKNSNANFKVAKPG